MIADKTLRYKFDKNDDPDQIAQHLVNNYKNALKDGIHFNYIELRIEDKEREYQVMGKIYELDSEIYRMVEVIY